ncbi:hypothetical protein Ppa06_37780 [Planomonospora parontospora subsp. parontospora]|uniref:Integrase catalytic domain-containing protein n=2 Tax=Planomonospora parontospora TaxID=58119 RepID=A0AA37BIR5_9ACTN|nr:hypothetical protein GCM10010126_41130 [Planomonospora parontospora]GII09980.1 hypothetical protein Ppa06_37780 [Planomonospora parontospora subsp. parontospora]
MRSRQQPADQAVPDLLERVFTASAPDRRYVGDITYLPTGDGRFLYLATVIDPPSRRLAGWSIADHMCTEVVTDALRAVAATRGGALAESFFATLKGELLGDRAWSSRAAARSAIFESIEGWYNLHRLHSSLGCVSPAVHEAAVAA